MPVTAEQLGYWYLRLNGFLTTVSFVVHPEQGDSQRTDVDILGVRFPHRAEMVLGNQPMEDDNVWLTDPDRPLVVITEANAAFAI